MAALTLRPYQNAALDALDAYWADGGGNGLIVLPTGAGKSLVIATLVREMLEAHPSSRIGVITHVRELISQNAQELMRIWSGAPVGIYSAGLGRRDAHARVLFMGIQSVHDKHRQLGHFDLLLVDEAHLMPRSADTMYGRFIAGVREASPDMRVVGLTATPYRLDSGRLDRGRGAIFDRIVYEANVCDLIDAGYLSPLISKRTASEIDVSGVRVRGGEFVEGELERAACVPELVEAAVAEIVALGETRAGWLLFCTGVDHCREVRDALRRHGIVAEMVTGATDKAERDRVVRSFKSGSIRALVSVNVLSIGFNAPHVDLVAMLRPTLSTGLYVQQVGRGFRLAEGKQNCLVLDYAGNIRRHGPVDAVAPAGKSAADEGEFKASATSVRAKVCPSCESYVALAAFTCPACGHEWPRAQEAGPKHEAKADEETPVLSRERPPAGPVTLEVSDTSFASHHKVGSPVSLRVEYRTPLQVVREWLCFEHTGFAREKAGIVWRRLGGELPVPETVEEALDRVEAGEIGEVYEITVRETKNGFNEVVGRRVRERERTPEASKPLADDDAGEDPFDDGMRRFGW